ncbi:cytochrome c oxidase subunit II [Hyalangium rubrum]|uniref:cytochrome-c oxidase n=1 Tax=Hyalangium rubrum TaxID=3103134 RepID=A0ABU5H2L5_9BACT|nr:cytochrome c oxidase subunit II [Hyalangium sp. s54d21]MDY7227702.1 cytochrome c oxidase subunit II [Hyalangium sp. s54d21]
MKGWALLCALLLAGCRGAAQSVLEPAGPSAARIHALWNVFLAICTGVFVLVVVTMLLAVLRRRVDPEIGSSPPEVDAEALLPKEKRAHLHAKAVEPATERRLAQWVATAAALTVVLLLVLLVTNTLTGKALAALRSEHALEVEVVGHQWWWEFKYRDPEPSRLLNTANELHIPVGRPVALKLTSRDVIHSFWVPNLAGKRDLIPGQENTLLLQADKPGVYRGLCAEFCGHQHAKMAFLVVAEPPEAFEKWREHQLQPAAPPMELLTQRGQQVFLTGPCVLCHAIQGTSASATVGPNLTHLASRQTLAAATLPNVRGHLAGWILNSQSLKPGNKMPPITLPPEDLHALLAYLESLK